jgi:hypothetical protein
MHRTVVLSDGSIELGDQARLAGYTPGAVVDVIVTCAGSLILALDDSVPLDAQPAAAISEREAPLPIALAWREP